MTDDTQQAPQATDDAPIAASDASAAGPAAASDGDNAAPGGVEQGIGIDIDKLTEDQLDALLKKVPEDKFKNHPEVNRRISRHISEQSKRMQREQQEQQTRIAEATQTIRQIESMSKEQRAEVYESRPELLTQYKAAKELLEGDGIRGAVAERILKNLYKSLKEDAEFADLEWKDVNEHPDASEMLRHLTKQGLEKGKKAMEKEFSERVRAEVNEILAKRGIQAEEPIKITANQVAGKHYGDKAALDVAFLGGEFGPPHSAKAMKEYQTHCNALGIEI